MRVLVVEDEEDFSTLLRAALTRNGHTVEVAANGDDGLASALASDFDALVLDVSLPGRDGFSVCRALRDAGRTVPVLMLTALQSVDDRARGFEAGVDDYLTKPFALPELHARLQALVRPDRR